MNIEDFDFELPRGLIANEPAESRDASRMLHVERTRGTIADRTFRELPKMLIPGDLIVLNNTRVFPARLNGRIQTGAAVEILLEEELDINLWKVLARPAKRLKNGRTISFEGELSAVVVERTEDGRAVLEFQIESDLWKALERFGNTPLPHYISRTKGEMPGDRERYQTIYAKQRGAIAAPTAGLHFTDVVLDRLHLAGIKIVEITLHVGYGTFEPVRVNDLRDHKVLPERIEISDSSASALNDAKAGGRRIIAIGTTTTRALETSIGDDGIFHTLTTKTSLTVTPGFKFRAVDALLTNFHLPKSSLLVLVSTFGGHELIMKAYKHAVAHRYRFYSYGDCMFIE